MLAALGLIGFGLFTLGVATTNDIPGDPLHYVVRQAAYGIVGLVLLFAVARIDYSRFRELRVGIYAAMIASITIVLVFGAAARGSRRRIELPFFGFQPSEFGKVLLIAALAGFVMERVPAGADGEPDGADPDPRPAPGGARLPPARPRHARSSSA